MASSGEVIRIVPSLYQAPLYANEGKSPSRLMIFERSLTCAWSERG